MRNTDVTKDVHITVTGTQFDEDGHRTVTEQKVQGQYFERDGSRYLLYEERDSDTGTVTKNTIKVKESTVELSRNGYISSRMVFCPGETHRTSHVTPYGILTLDIYTESLKSVWAEKNGTLQVAYRMYAEENLLSENKLSVKVTARAKDRSDFSEKA